MARLDGYLVYLLKQIDLGLRPHVAGIVARHGLSIPGYTALAVLLTHPGISSAELARRSFVRAQTMAETVTDLLADDLIRREPDPDDGRRLRLSITERGSSKVEAVAPDIRRFEESIATTVPVDERETFERHLRAVRDRLHEV